MNEVNEFFSRVKYSNGCWDWQGYKQNQGYGFFYFNGNTVIAHRWSYDFFREDPKYLLCCHHCDNPSCVNPFHMFLGTHKDNAQDMISKGRHKEQRKTHCKYGHRLIGNNLHVNKKGYRICKQCRREYWNSWRKYRGEK